MQQKGTEAILNIYDNIFLVFCIPIFQQTIGIPMGQSCAPLFADFIFFNSMKRF